MNRQITQWIFRGSLILLMTLVAACNSKGVDEQVEMTLTAIYDLQPTSTNTATPSPTATLTLTPIPSLIPTQLPPPPVTDTPPFTETPAITEAPQPSCLGLLTPENGATLQSTGKQTFEWEPLSEASNYLLEINPPPYHNKQTFESKETSLYRWLDTIPWAGDYSWQVSALNAKGKVICVSEPFTFTKPEFVPTKTPRNEPAFPPTCTP